VNSFEAIFLSSITEKPSFQTDECRADVIDESDRENDEVACGEDRDDPEETCKELAQK